MPKKRQIITSLVHLDKDTGEKIGNAKTWLEPKPDKIFFPYGFAKIHFKAVLNMPNILRGRFVMLLDYLDYDTNKLVDKGPGRLTVPLNRENMAHIMELEKRQGYHIIRQMKNLSAIFKIDGDYYINPRFASRNSGINVEIIEKMLVLDPLLPSAMNKTQWKKLQLHIKEG
tara:strand:+ start:6247 stop:6759 length:513 start_codon:yes stop_codon:yes gene_type:complete